MYKKIFFVFYLIMLFSWNSILSQTEGNSVSSIAGNGQNLKIFLDCDDCKMDYLLNKLSFVDIVRDPKQSQIYILVTKEKTAAKGKKYSLSFIGKNEYQSENYKTYFTITQSETELNLQKKFSKIILFGLTNYVSGNELIENYEINYNTNETKNRTIQTNDPWKSWVFSIKLNGGFEAEENNISADFKTKVSAEKITEDWKIINKISYETEQEKFIDDNNSITSKLFKKEFKSKAVYSMSDNWSSGLIGEINSSTYRNISLSYKISSAVEYNFIPWQESATKYITMGYYFGFMKNKYYEETLFNKTKELLFQHTVKLATRFMAEWGSYEGELKYSQFPWLKSIYNIEFKSDLSLRIFEGFSIALEFIAESIHDQIYLAKGDASLEEILLKRTQLATTYNIQMAFGLKYTFGSIYNNVVNERL